jgi:signal transduction histidine kinase
MQEAFSNIVKHAGATLVTVRLAQGNAKTLILEITDNGSGIEAGFRDSKKAGFGLENIKYRVEKMAGKFSIKGSMNSGTHISIRFPIPL